MAENLKIIDISGIGRVTFKKNRRQKNMRLGVDSAGVVTMSLPFYTPYAAGQAFVLLKKAWILEHMAKAMPPMILKQGHIIGKEHTLCFLTTSSASIRSRVTSKNILVYITTGKESTDSDVQLKTVAACEKALMLQAEFILPPRLRMLSEAYKLPYNSVSIKKLKRRWGSCSNTKDITLNYFLMQLPDNLINYVLAHELNHTKHMNHKQAFWDNLELLQPGAKNNRKSLKRYSPHITAMTS